MKKSLKSQGKEELLSRLKQSDTLNIDVQKNRLRYFIPTGKQDEFATGINKGDVFVGIYSGANGPGKTALETNISGNIIWGPQSEWFAHPLYQNWPHAMRARIGSTRKNLEEIGAIETEIKTWWPKGRYVAEKKGKPYNSLYKCKGRDGDWVIDVMSYDQDVKQWESATLGLAIFDEPPPKEIFNATVARMRRGGIILIFMTPLSDAAWVFDDLLEKGEGLKANQRIFTVYTDIEDSCEEHGVRGFLRHKDIETMTSFYDAEEKEARIHGRPVHLAGRIYKLFNENIHVIDDFPIPDDWPRANIIDPHDAYPFAISWAAVNKTNDYFIYDEYPNEPFQKLKGTNLTFVDYATIIRNKEGRHKIDLRLMDPNFGRKNYAPLKSGGKVVKTVADEMAEFGLVYDTNIEDSLDVGHLSVRERFKYDITKPISAINHPKYYIFRSCRNHWSSVLKYSHKRVKPGEMKEKVAVEETHKHFPDNMRYLSVSGFSYHVIKYDYKGEDDYQRMKRKAGSAMAG